jgi:hypothetical protein
MVHGKDNDTGLIAGTDPLHKEGDRIIDWVSRYSFNLELGSSC